MSLQRLAKWRNAAFVLMASTLGLTSATARAFNQCYTCHLPDAACYYANKGENGTKYCCDGHTWWPGCSGNYLGTTYCTGYGGGCKGDIGDESF